MLEAKQRNVYLPLVSVGIVTDLFSSVSPVNDGNCACTDVPIIRLIIISEKFKNDFM
jgi:hypothetical protein